jgi:hypothetical protein
MSSAPLEQELEELLAGAVMQGIGDVAADSRQGLVRADRRRGGALRPQLVRDHRRALGASTNGH